MEENKKIPDAKISVKGRFFTWLENYWYHYKWPTIIGAVAVVIVAVCLWQTSSTKSYDTVIIYAGPVNLSTNETIQLQEALSGILPYDRDESGEKSAAMSMYQIYSEEQIKKLEQITDSKGKPIYSIDRTRNTRQLEEYNTHSTTGQSPVCFLDPYLYDMVPDGYLYPMSKVFGDEIPQGAIGDGYGIRLGDTELYEDYGVLQLLPADTIICLKAPLEGLGQKLDDKKYAYDVEVFKALALYESSETDGADSESDSDVTVGE